MPVLGSKSIFCAVLCGSSLLGSAAQAATITGSFTDPEYAAYTKMDLSADTDGWVAYGYNNTQSALSTKAGGQGNFSALMDESGNALTSSNLVIPSNGRIKLKWSDGAPTATFDADATWIESIEGSGNNGKGLSFTTTLFASSETLRVLVASKNSSAHAALSAVIDSAGNPGSYSVTDVNLSDYNTHTNHDPYALLTLNIATATVGDVLTFKITSDFTSAGAARQNWWAVGLSAATVSAVPEPACVGLLAVGGLLARRRRR
jgi:hypothetical protein